MKPEGGRARVGEGIKFLRKGETGGGERKSCEDEHERECKRDSRSGCEARQSSPVLGSRWHRGEVTCTRFF